MSTTLSIRRYIFPQYSKYIYIASTLVDPDYEKLSLLNQIFVQNKNFLLQSSSFANFVSSKRKKVIKLYTIVSVPPMTKLFMCSHLFASDSFLLPFIWSLSNTKFFLITFQI